MKLSDKMYDGPLPPGLKSKAEFEVRMVRCVAQDQETGVRSPARRPRAPA
ncbi:hypothetical protein ABIF70_005225 [Bradyrhizobium japonicum]